MGVEFEVKSAAAGALLMLTKIDKKEKNCIKVKVVQSVEPNSVRVQTEGARMAMKIGKPLNGALAVDLRKQGVSPDHDPTRQTRSTRWLP